MSRPSILDNLNPEQLDAVTSTEGALLVIAGAGSGKTRVITRRITYLIEEKGVEPWHIFGATFTNKAAREMKKRIGNLCKYTDTGRLPVHTFHSHCATILRREALAAGLTPHFTICDATDQTALVRDCLNVLGHNPKHLKPSNVLEVISLAKMRLLSGEAACEFIDQMRDESQSALYRLYQKRLRNSDAVDFDDLLLIAVNLFRDNPHLLESYQDLFRYVLVDEYQDTNLAQFELVRLLTQQHRNLCVVGDEDQSIYSWRGAEITNLLEFQKRFPEAKVIRLEQNYRSTGNILKAAGAVIARNTQRLGKKLWTAGCEGDEIVLIDARNEHHEAQRIVEQILLLNSAGMDLQQIAVFYRVNALSRVFEEALRSASVPYQVVGGVGFYDRAEIKDIIAYLQIVANPGNVLALMRVINKPRRGIGKKALDNLIVYADSQNMAPFEVMTSPEHLKAAEVKGKAAAGALDLSQRITEWVGSLGLITLRELVEEILDKTGYIEALGDPQSIDVLSRKENIAEFLGSLEQYSEQFPDAKLTDYLESVALRATGENEKNARGVSLMTVHNAKGLEFDVVFVTALEKDIFPNARAVRDQGHAEEERRLFYVALTRARRRIYLSFTGTRQLYGETSWPTPSQFIHEIPPELRVRLSEADLPAMPPAPMQQVDPSGFARVEEEVRFARTAARTKGESMEEIAKRLGRNEAPVMSESPSLAMPEAASASPSSLMTQKQSSGQAFLHKTLGVVHIVAEKGFAGQKRLVVRDDTGTEHTLLASYANLKPIPQASPSIPESNDDMPF